MTTIAELLQQDPIRIEKRLSYLYGGRYTHVPEIVDHIWWDMEYEKDKCKDIEIHIFHEAVLDHRRSWVLFGVKFKDTWVMLCRNAGRELDDFSDRCILDEAGYRSLVQYIYTEYGTFISPEISCTPLDTIIDFTFYGHDVRYKYFV